MLTFIALMFKLGILEKSRFGNVTFYPIRKFRFVLVDSNFILHITFYKMRNIMNLKMY